MSANVWTEFIKMQNVAQLILEKAGCLVEIAKDGKKAVEHFKESGINYYHAIFKQPH